VQVLTPVSSVEVLTPRASVATLTPVSSVEVSEAQLITEYVFVGPCQVIPVIREVQT
jgi:hypothetical protein